MVMISTRKKSRSCQRLTQLPGALSTPGAASNLCPGGKCSIAPMLANRASQPATGIDARVSLRPIPVTSTRSWRNSTPVSPGSSPFVISRFSPYSVALSRA